MLNRKTFTYTEVLLSLIILTIALTALIETMNATIMNRQESLNLSKSNILLQAIKEHTAQYSFDNYDNWLPSPYITQKSYEFSSTGNIAGPITANGIQYDGDLGNEFSTWRQVIEKSYLDESNLTQILSDPATSNILKISVKIYDKNTLWKEAQWYAFKH